MKLPESVKPIWRTVQVIRISKGLDDGLRLFILGPYFYGIFKRLATGDTALLYTSLIWAIYCGLIAVLEIPTGAFADVFGRVRATISCFVLSSVFGVGLASLFLFHNIAAVFILAMLSFICRSAAVTLYNGAFAAWVIDGMRDKGVTIGYEQLLSRGYAYYSWSMLVGGVLGVTLYLHNVTYVAFITGSLICLACTMYCAAEMRESSSLVFGNFKRFWDEATYKMASTVATAFRVCYRYPVLWWLVLIYAGYYFLLGLVSYMWPVVLSDQYGTQKWSIDWYVMALGMPIIAAIGSHAMAWFGKCSKSQDPHRMSSRVLLVWYMGSCIVAALPILILGILQHHGAIAFPIFAVGVFALQSTMGITETCYATLMSHYLPDQHAQERSTILSMSTMLSGFMLLILTLPSNGFKGTASTAGWVIPSGILLALVVLGMFKIKSYSRSQVGSNLRKEVADETI